MNVIFVDEPMFECNGEIMCVETTRYMKPEQFFLHIERAERLGYTTIFLYEIKITEDEIPIYGLIKTYWMRFKIVK